MFNTHELRQMIQQKLTIPEDELESYIAFHEDDQEPKFNIIWTSKKLLARVGKEMTQDDATYRYATEVTSVFIQYVWCSNAATGLFENQPKKL